MHRSARDSILDEPVESFRMAFWPIFVLVVLLGVPLGSTLGVVGSAVQFGTWFFDPMAFVVGIATGEAACFILTLPMVLYYRIYVGPGGVRGFNFWGIYRNSAWDDFQWVRPFLFIGLPFLRAQTAGARLPLWLPVLLTDRARFRFLVRQYAGPSHPLAVALEES